MRTYSNLPLRDLLNAFAAAAPAPGGGSAAALAGATGVSLLLMTIGIRLSKPADSTLSAALTDAADRLRSLHAATTALIDRDADAYSSVVAALRLPADPGQAGRSRQVALDSALRGATDIPLEIMRACRGALRAATTVAANCTRNTRGDVGVAIELLQAAVRGAGLTIDANLGSLREIDYVGKVRDERQRLESESAADADYGRAQLSGQPG
jgi:formiminotetrahydrofolate cyclodeaminase